MIRRLLALALLVTSLGAVHAPVSVTLEWTAPQDNVGVKGYELRYSLRPITPENFPQATLWTRGVPVPGAPGTTERVTIGVLQEHTLYWFAIRSRDASGNVSALSNVVTFGTTASGGCGNPAPPDTLRLEMPS